MKKNLLHFYIVATVLFSDYLMFAQPSDDSDPDDGPPLEGDDLPMAPINSKLIWLAVLGSAFAYYTYKRNRRTA